MANQFAMDAYAPAEIAGRVEAAAVKKAHMPLLELAMLGARPRFSA